MSTTITHDEVLARLALAWIEIVPSRRTMAKRNLPTYAHEPSPNVIVVAHPADKTAFDLCSQFRQKHWKPRFNSGHVPSKFVWQIVTPTEERLLIFTWVNWLRNSQQMFEEFCRDTNHEFGTLTQDGVIVMASRRIPFQDCRLMHEDQFRPRPPVTVKKQSAKSILAKAEELLTSRKSKFEDVDYRELYDDEEAHDDELQGKLEANFLANMASYEKALSAKFGPPTEVASDEHKSIPINGVVRYAIWAVGKKRLYLIVSHEDTELPWVIHLGVTV